MAKRSIVSLRKPFTAYKAIVFDVDGTLYWQRGLRRTMGKQLLCYFLRHPLRWKELLALVCYRLLRENWESAERSGDSGGTEDDKAVTMETLQYQHTAKKLHMDSERVKKTVQYWMQICPLRVLEAYKDRELCALLTDARRQGKIIAAYSDYPAADKLKALQLEADAVFSSADREIDCMKPNRKAMQVILKKLGVDKKDVVMIGDRYEKDGAAAKNAGVDYIILGTSLSARHLLYQALKTGIMAPDGQRERKTGFTTGGHCGKI